MRSAARSLLFIALLLPTTVGAAAAFTLRTCFENSDSYPWLLQSGEGIVQYHLKAVATVLDAETHHNTRDALPLVVVVAHTLPDGQVQRESCVLCAHGVLLSGREWAVPQSGMGRLPMEWHTRAPPSVL